MVTGAGAFRFIHVLGLTTGAGVDEGDRDGVGDRAELELELELPLGTDGSRANDQGSTNIAPGAVTVGTGPCGAAGATGLVDTR